MCQKVVKSWRLCVERLLKTGGYVLKGCQKLGFFVSKAGVFGCIFLGLVLH